MLKNGKKDKLIEILVVFLLGITTILTAYTSWQVSLCGGSQSTNYTESMRANEEEVSLYNQADALLALDMNIYNEIVNLRLDLKLAQKKGDSLEMEIIQAKIDNYKNNNISSELADAMNLAELKGNGESPFNNKGFIDQYYQKAYTKNEKGNSLLEEGKVINDKSDILGLANVIYSVTLFLLGIISTLGAFKIKAIMFGMSFVLCIIASVIMATSL